MTAALCAAAAGVALWLLMAARSALNNLSSLALAKMVESQEKRSRILREFMERQPSFLVSLQVGTIVAGVALVVSCERLFAAGGGGNQSVSGLLTGLLAGVAIVVLAQLAAAANPPFALSVGLPFLRFCWWLLAPISLPVAAILSRLLAAYHGRQAGDGESDKDGEIAALIDVGRREGILEGDDSVLVQNVLEFGDTVVREVMTPRTDMVCAPADISVGDAVALLARARHTRLPLYEGQVDNITGIATAKDLLGPLLGGEKGASAKRFAQPALFVPENKPISKLLREFQQQKVQIAMVVDEYGGVSGLCTTEDLLEEIVGEIQENYEADEAPFRVLEPGVVEALGRASVYDVAEALGVELQKGSYDSVAGWLITALGSIPKNGERATVEGLEVEVLSADKKRVHRVRVARPLEKTVTE
ncbi:MAG: HlyC/CorC family transporter [Acidobacteria bacterium]|jgi:CBS domain containing-hemolysin-like protein|nr:HlyC/CorC family transporter [Acidobacteriota bacterium]